MTEKSTQINTPHEFVPTAESTPTELGIEYQKGLEAAAELQFDLEASVRFDHPELKDKEVSRRIENIYSTVEGIAGEIGLKPDFLEQPANAILLAAVADSWLTNEEQSAQGNPHNKRLGDEREMLADFALILAGEQSAFNQSLRGVNDTDAERYLSGAETAQERELREFYESVSDTELSQAVADMLAQRGGGSFLAEQRAKLGINGANERPFSVRVLNIGNQWSLKRAGLHFEEIEWPEYKPGLTDEERAELREQGKIAEEKHQANKALAEPYERAEKDYEERFGEEHGPLPPAFVSFKHDGSAELTLLAADAMVLINAVRDGRQIPMETRDITRTLALIKHEYAHTQKSVTAGEHNQLGLLLEERKAESISGDKHGYQDVKYLVQDLYMATGVNILQELDDAVTRENPLANFLASISSRIGLRTALLLMASKPLPYDKDPEYSKKFINIACIRNARDSSSLDVIVRDHVERRGDETMRSGAEKWAKNMVKQGSDIAFIGNSYLPYREGHGAGHGTAYLRRALDEHLASLSRSA